MLLQGIRQITVSILSGRSILLLSQITFCFHFFLFLSQLQFCTPADHYQTKKMNQEYSHINYPVITDENRSIMEPHINLYGSKYKVKRPWYCSICRFQSRKQDMIYILAGLKLCWWGSLINWWKYIVIPYQFSFQLLSKLIDVLWWINW